MAFLHSIPGLRYHDGKAAIDWLCKAFGMEATMVVDNEEGVIEHAQLRRGTCIIMLGSIRDDKFKGLLGTPKEMDGRNTQAPYIVVESHNALEKLFASAQAANAKMIEPLTKQEYGGSLFSCLDLEGNLWHFGTYDPFAPMPDFSQENQADK